MSELLRNVIHIPERSGAEDYVLRLTDSVEADHLQRTLDEYVVTPAIADAFDQALDTIGDAIAQDTSRAAFLKGSFGSGKSHFMAVLYALLRQDARARGKEGLAEVVAAHDGQLQEKRILPLTFHLLGAESMESALFDAYLTQIGRLHPEAPLPALHESTLVLADAEALRARMGDDAFLASLSDGAEGDADDVWGAFLGSTTWTLDRYQAARAAAPGEQRRQELVTALINTHFTSYRRQAQWVDIDTGLAAISSHAASLGYDAVVLFLDELVLWLAFGVRDDAFFRREAQKLSKLVEGGNSHRPIPLVSFVARQLDLRQWFADSGASGAQQQALDQAFAHQQGRFGEIRLGDDNLPFVAQRRLLRPVDDAAAALLQTAFDGLSRTPAVWDVLLDGINTDDRHRGADQEAFRRTYPFSPALISTLRSLASVMQRDRTALKVMQQMLVDRRESLTIDDVIPVGDAFDYLVDGKEALDAESAALFRSAKALWTDKLQGIILRNNELTLADVDEGRATTGYRTDERLAKTLLLSAVAPNVPALKSLDASRVASLNHGSIRSPLPGQVASTVLAKVRNWAREVPELRVGDGANPRIQLELSDVNYESIIDRAKGEENAGRLRELIKTLVSEALGVPVPVQDSLEPFRTHEVIWRGTRRTVDVVFGNVRDRSWVSDDAFEARPGTWRFVIDFPYDETGHSIAEDRARLDELHARNFISDTIVWLPHFFSEERLRDARRLVVLRYLLDGTGERYQQYADHLSETDRVQAKAILESQKEALLHTLKAAIEVAYDTETSMVGRQHVQRDEGHDQVLNSFNLSFAPELAASGGLRGAFERLIDQAFAAKYPGHPEFLPGDEEVRPKELQVLAAYVEQALADPDRRIPLDHDAGPVRRLAKPLGVGYDAETHFLMGEDRFTTWGPAIARGIGARAAAPDAPLTVAELRSWIRATEKGKGLPEPMMDVVILAWAALGQRAWYANGAAIPAPAPGKILPSMELREQPMPTAEEWDRASRLAGMVFGAGDRLHPTPSNVANLSKKVADQAREWASDARKLQSALDDAATQLGMADAGRSARQLTAALGADLTHTLQFQRGVELIRTLAAAEVPEPTKLGRALSSAAEVEDALRRFQWSTLESVRDAARGEGPHTDEPARILSDLRYALGRDEFDSPLGDALGRASADAIRWMNTQMRTPSPAPNPTPVEPTPSGLRGHRRITSGSEIGALADELRTLTEQHPGEAITVEWRLGQ